MKSSKFFTQIILLILVSISCTKRDEVDINYNELSSLVSSEAKTINFFKKNLQLNSDRFPIVKIEENTFLDQTIVETEGTIFPKTNLPENWGLINETNYGWSFSTSNEPLKDLEINIFYGIPNEKMLLTGWEDKFTLYAKHKDSTSFDAWRKAEAIHNKGERKFTITENFKDNIYFIAFEELQRYDVWKMSGIAVKETLSEFVDPVATFSFSDFNYDFFDINREANSGIVKKEDTYIYHNRSPGNPFSSSNSHIVKIFFDSTANGFKNINLEIDFYDEKRGVFRSGNLDNDDLQRLTIEELGTTGEQITGQIEGWIYADNPIDNPYNDGVDYNRLFIVYKFNLKRMR